MPNHVYHSITVTGKKEAVDNFKKHFTVDKSQVVAFDFNTIIPMPEHIFHGNLGDEERTKYGRDNWYDWSLDNWHTKWNAYDTELVEDADESFSFNFQTAWSFPQPIIDKLIEMHPDLVFDGHANEEAGFFNFDWDNQDGMFHQYDLPMEEEAEE